MKLKIYKNLKWLIVTVKSYKIVFNLKLNHFYIKVLHFGI
jgi:hypothetical protein